MQTFCRVALLDVVWRAIICAALILGLIYVLRAEPAIALLIGAHVAMLFTVLMILCALLVTTRGIEASRLWLELAPHERPQGNAARHSARIYFAALMLRFAQAAAAAGATLAALSLLLRA